MSNAPQNQKSTDQSTLSANPSNAGKDATIPLKDETKAQSGMKDKSPSTPASASENKSSTGAKS